MRSFALKLALVFILAYGLNIIWELAHHVLYIHYKGGEITTFILARAALVDASIITALAFVIQMLPTRHSRPWIMIAGGVAISVLIEYWALASDRWAYKAAMPIIPILETGLTPTVQLALLGLIAYKLVFHQKIVIY